MLSTTKAARLKAVFKKYDLNGDGVISRDELEAVLKALMHLPPAEIGAVWLKLDKNRDGKIEYEEFIDFISSGDVKDPDKEGKWRASLASGMTLKDAFKAFCGAGHDDIDSTHFQKMCHDCGFIDSKLPAKEVDIIFAKVLKGVRRASFQQFEAALQMVAEARGMDLQELHRVIQSSGGPTLHGTTAGACRFHDDKSTYTGARAHGAAKMEPTHHVAGFVDRSPANKAAHPNEKLTSTKTRRASVEGELFAMYTSGVRDDVDPQTFAKLCRDCHFIDESFTLADADHIFHQVTGRESRHMNAKQFTAALAMMATKKDVPLQELHAWIEHNKPDQAKAGSGRPSLSAAGGLVLRA
eukprot:gnl/TRDRNA2_/TRDRNA2_92017_c0_seq1.p1 gnl/TRDRNA2_/TRDRNA2_92017_c0~~gnl/TRDRNA2_/TRDRNA2_92017_c0_seq1.p1  ORF type:complete len:354 (-),score=86.36 gnl/TRDRNA2_/TRDRNA2_92017_c0_seq1:100-1161(-)